MTALSFSDLFARALRGADCEVVGVGATPDAPPEPLPMADWDRPAQKSDLAVLDLCVGVTMDVGCGPGRMAAALTERGHDVLAIDVVGEAVRLARERGVAAFQRDVFEALPHEGSWNTVLLADGNIGIGGDPVALLRRVAELVEPGGQVVVDLAAPGLGVVTRWAHLRCDGQVSKPFRWSLVSADVIEELAQQAGLQLRTLQVAQDDRWTAVLRRPPGIDADLLPGRG